MKRTFMLCLFLILVLLAAAVAPAWAFVPTDAGGWVVQNESPEGYYLLGITFVDADHGWAVGGDDQSGSAIILATSDGGTTWTTQDPGTTYQNEALGGVCFVDADHGWAVGGRWDASAQSRKSVILHTSDGGITWIDQSPGTTPDLEAVAFSDADHGWAVGTGGTILATSDGGSHWTEQDSGTTAYLPSVSFPDASHGWAVAYDGHAGWSAILNTADGGASWAPSITTAGVSLESVCFPDAGHGWAVGRSDNQGVILATTDGGATWTEQDAGTTTELDSVCFVDADHGWAVGRDYQAGSAIVLATSDGGVTWTAQDVDSVVGLTRVCFVDTTHGWAIGDQTAILATTTGGWPDTIAPTTTISGADGLWHNTNVDLTLTATDNPGGTGSVPPTTGSTLAPGQRGPRSPSPLRPTTQTMACTPSCITPPTMRATRRLLRASR